MTDSVRYPKYGIPARVTLTNGSHLMGIVYLKQNERILDMLCDNRPFFPVLLLVGLTLLNKAAVVQIDVLGPDDIDGKEHLLPSFDQKHFERLEKSFEGTVARRG